MAVTCYFMGLFILKPTNIQHTKKVENGFALFFLLQQEPTFTLFDLHFIVPLCSNMYLNIIIATGHSDNSSLLCRVSFIKEKSEKSEMEKKWQGDDRNSESPRSSSFHSLQTLICLCSTPTFLLFHSPCL